MTERSEAQYQCGLAAAAQGRHDQAIAAFEIALKENPTDIRVLYALGHTAEAMGMIPTAAKLYRQVLTLAPQKLEPLVALSNLLRAAGKYDAAETLLAPAMRRKAIPAEMWLSYGSLQRERGKDAAAIACYRQALQIRPDYIPALGNLADMYADTGHYPEAQTLYHQILTLAPKHHQARFSQAMTLLAMGNYKAGWQGYESRLDHPDAPIANHNLPRWKGDFRTGMRLLVSMEQGLGDQIMFAALYTQLIRDAESAGARILIACEPRLAPLFTRSFPSTAVLPCRAQNRQGRNYIDYSGLAACGGADCFIEAGSLPGHFGLSPDSPRPGAFLKPDAKELAAWQHKLQRHPRPWIGVCWRSGKLGGLRSRQYAAPEIWGEAMRDLPGTLISVQYDANESEVLGLKAISQRELVIPSGLDQKKEIDRSCALLATLDLVISAPTAVVWQSAGVGTKVARIEEVPSWTLLGTAYERFSAMVTPCVAPEAGAWSGAFDKAKSLIP